MTTSRRIVPLVTLALLLMIGSQTLAAAEVDTALAAVEGGLGQIEKSSRITDQVNLDSLLDRYLAEIEKNHTQTFQALEDEAKKATVARRATTTVATKLQVWEDQMSAHRVRMEKVLSRLTIVNMKVRDGRILFAPELLKKLPKEEIEELRKWLTPETIRKYQTLDKSLFAAGPLDGGDSKPVLVQELGLPAGCSACRPRSQSPMDWLGDLLAPADAEAAIAAGCVGVCSAQPEFCFPCLVAAGFGADQTVKLFKEEFDKCNSRRTRIGRAICKTAVVLGFIVTIA